MIEDPELAKVPHLEQSEKPPPVTFRLELHSRTGVDTHWTYFTPGSHLNGGDAKSSREDIVESTSIAIFEADYRRSEDLSFAVGLRARYEYATRQFADVDGRATRYELDAVPIAAYVDANVADGIHVRGGYQIISMGRFDFFSASNFLAVLDFRNGLTTMPEATDVAQPALRVDIDITPKVTLQSIYVPFFQPHLITVAGNDYALLALLDQTTPPIYADPKNPSGTFLQRAVQRSQLPDASNGAFHALGVQPDLDHPQGAMRLTARPKGGEVAVTAGTALEHIPSIEFSPQMIALLENTDPDPNVAAIKLLDVFNGPAPFRFVYNRFYTLGTDAALDLGPLQLGAEVAYIGNRTYLAAKHGRVPLPGSSDVGHLALRAELVETAIVGSVEGFYEQAFDDPREPDRKWMMLEDGRRVYGVATAIHLTPPGTPLAFDLVAIYATIRTLFVTPRVEIEAAERLWFELGAFFMEGRRPSPANFGDPDISIGGVYDGIDQVYAGVRWVP